MRLIRLIRKRKRESDKTPKEELIIDEQLIQDLIDFTGLNRDYITKHLNRVENCTYVYEYKVRNPKNDSELDWFYVTSEKYLFANIVHKPWELIDMVRGEKILDYGGGAGTDTFYLTDKGYNVHYFDISITQREFVKFRKNKYKLDNLTIIEPFFNSKFDPINCITETYDGILVRSLLEHIPYYSKLVERLISKLNEHGIIYEASKFSKSEKDPMHISEKESLEEILKSHRMKLIYQKGIHRCWEKLT